MNENLCQMKYCTLFILHVISADFYFCISVKMNTALIYHITEESYHMFKFYESLDFKTFKRIDDILMEISQAK